MNYEFPIIKRIEDVLPAIEGRDEFVVAEREGYTVINYKVAFEDTFPPINVAGGSAKMRAERAAVNAMRRECRGLIFYPDGKIMSRPFHKFFNVGERDETQMHKIDMTAPHTIMEKMDGSMIRPIIVDGRARLATKMGLTDTAAQAEEYFMSRPNAVRELEFLESLVLDGVTPLFEFVSPENRIVLEYQHTDLVLLALRNNFSGEYMRFAGAKGDKIAKMFSVVPEYGSVVGSLEDYIARQRGMEGREGDIIRFADGHMLKIKNDWYVRIHKVKDQIRSDRHILALLLENQLDDVLPHMDANDFDRVKAFEADFHAQYRAKLAELDKLAKDVISKARGDRKALATTVLPQSGADKADWRYVFGVADGKDLNDMLMAHVRSRLGSGTKYEELAKFLGLEVTGDEE